MVSENILEFRALLAFGEYFRDIKGAITRFMHLEDIPVIYIRPRLMCTQHFSRNT